MFRLTRASHKLFVADAKCSRGQDPVLVVSSGCLAYAERSRGQALLESVLVLPFISVVFCSLMLGFHHLGSHYLFDHWTYQSALCLAKENDSVFCKNQLKKRLGFIPFSRFSITEFYKSKKQVRIRLKADTPFLSDGEILEELRLPIKINDLEQAQ